MLNSSLKKRLQEINSTISIREAEISDGQNFIDLINHSYSKKKTIDYYIWRFFRCPYETKLFVAYDGAEYVGNIGVHLLPLTNRAVCGFIVDLLVEDTYRQRGIFYLLEKVVRDFAVRNGASLLACLPNVDGQKAYEKLPEWETVGVINTLELFNKPEMALKKNNKTGVSKSKLCSFLKKPVYRRWRYDENPLIKYDKISLSENSFGLVKIFVDPTTGERFGDLVELHVDLLKPRLVEKLIKKIWDFFSDKNLKVITLWAIPNSPLNKIAKDLGFQESSQQRFFCVKILDSQCKNLRLLANWHLAEGDSEVF